MTTQGAEDWLYDLFRFTIFFTVFSAMGVLLVLLVYSISKSFLPRRWHRRIRRWVESWL